MGKAFLGRLQVYESVIEVKDTKLQEALMRNVYRGNTDFSEYAERLASYARQIDENLADTPIKAIMEGEFALHWQ